MVTEWWEPYSRFWLVVSVVALVVVLLMVAWL